MKLTFPLAAATVLAFAANLPSQAAEPLPDLSKLVPLLYQGNRADNAASLSAAVIQMQAGNPVAALTRVVQNVRRGDIAARAQLVDWLTNGKLNFEPAMARNFIDEYTAAAAHGDGFGLLMLGLFGEYGFGPITPDIVKAIGYYERAVGGGNVWALTRLGLIYETGRPPAIPASLTAAAGWYDRASGVEAEATAHIVAMYRSKTPWKGREPRSESDLLTLEKRQQDFDAAHPVGP